MVIAIGLVGIGYGLAVSVTGDEANPLPASLEVVEPVPDAVQVLQQSNVFVDLAPGFTGRFVIDGNEIETVSLDEVGSLTAEPGQQIDIPPVTVYEPGNATLTFTPSAGGPIETFSSGVHAATVVYWLVEDGPARSRTYSWTFTVV